ncbi:MAG: hypothetical protein COV48_15335, partial [Elusimicrobia bacterium CG11_big_fil_rev_8_21_14_0_20_64_6]
KKIASFLDIRTPIVLAYGTRWDRKLWESGLQSKLPEFVDFPTIGVYIYYRKGKAIYIGINETKIHRRLVEEHKYVGDGWDAFSWFVINQQLNFRDIERFCLVTLTHLGPGQSRRTTDPNAPFPGNADPSGFLVERHSYRNYSLDEKGSMKTPRIDGMLLLTKEWQKKCRPNRNKKLWAKHLTNKSTLEIPGGMASAMPDLPLKPATERAVLGAMLISHEALCAAIRKYGDDNFAVIENRMIFHAFRALCAASQAVNVVTAVEFLRKMGQLRSVGGPNAITSLIEDASPLGEFPS